MDFFVVVNGDPFALSDATEDADGMRLTGQDGRRLWRQGYGVEWLVVAAYSDADAIAEAARFDARTHEAQVEMELFASAYRAGSFAIMQTDDLSG